VPVVRWHRSRIAVHPKEGWKPNRVYRVELLPGLQDLRNNRSKTGTVVTFTTGAPVPTHYLNGRVVDWGTRRPEALALVEAMLVADSLVYKTATDSTGHFNLGPLPDGIYVVSGILDQNKNRKRDRNEPYDTVRVLANRDSTGEIWAFKHDTVAARIQSIAPNDSISATVTFTQQLDPYYEIPKDSVRVRLLPDSTDVKVEAVLTKERYDSLYQVKPKKADSLAADTSAAAIAKRDSLARADSIARVDSIANAARAAARAARRRRGPPPPDTTGKGPLNTKPPLFDHVVVRLVDPLKPGAKYVVEFFGARSVSRVSGHAIQAFQVPEEKKDTTKVDSTKTDSVKAKGDSTKGKKDNGKAKKGKTDTATVRPDSTKAKPDTVKAAPPPSPAPAPAPPPAPSPKVEPNPAKTDSVKKAPADTTKKPPRIGG
jgi:hypothetical protein